MIAGAATHFALEPGINPAQDSLPMALKSEPSVVPAILLSDASIVERGSDKRSVVGIFDQVFVQSFPAPFGPFWVTAWVSNVVGTLSELELTCRIQESGGHVVFSSVTRVKFESEAPFNETTTLAFSSKAGVVRFQKEGVYTVVILLNGNEVGNRDFRVLLQPEPEIKK